MSNTSATGGYLVESGVLSRIKIEDIWHGVISGITGIAPKLVRPNYQNEPGATIGAGDTYAIFGLKNDTAIEYPETYHIGTGDGTTVVIDQVRKLLTVSFYGELADDKADMFRRALHIGQNREALRRAGIAVVRVGNPEAVPELVNEKWLRRVDMEIVTVYEAVGKYDILNLLRALS